MKQKNTGNTLVHSVYFSLKDKSDDAIERFIAMCDKYLGNQPGVRYYYAGRRTPDIERPINDVQFDVALLIVFEDRAAQDAYQTSESHCEFVAKTSPGWESIRVFDAGG